MGQAGSAQVLHVAVVGAGIVGACCALELLRAGHRVTIVDPGEPGGVQAASHGNGGWISPASVVPMSTPGLWRKVPGWLADRDGPLTIRPGAMPHLAPWLWRFLRAGADPARVRTTARVLGMLLHDAPERHAALAGDAGAAALIERRGLLYAYPSRAAFEQEAFSWSLRREQGIGWRTLERGSDDAVWTSLAPGLSARYRFGAHVEVGGHCRDPGAYVRALVARAEAVGARRVAARVEDWVRRAGRLVGLRVRTAGGGGLAELECDRAVLSAGIASAPLSRALGDRVPLTSERGYHLVLPLRTPPCGAGLDWPVPVMPSDGRMAVTLTPDGLRIAGQVELAAVDDAPDERRVDVLWRHARGLLDDHVWHAIDAGAGADGRPPVARPAHLVHWMGHRPSTPDGLPVIGPSTACPDVVFAFGHGHVGLATGPVTGECVRDLLQPAPLPPGRVAGILAACSPSRF